MSDVLAIATRIYGADLGDFVAARKREVEALKGSDDDAAERVAVLRKPTVGAWTVNQLVRSRAALVDELADLGERLRAAQEGSDGAAMRDLAAERRALVARCVDEARTVAKERDQLPTPAVLGDVEETVKAALVDPDAARMVREGLLVRPLSPAGFGSVDLTDALALPERAPELDEPDGDEVQEDASALTTARKRAETAREASREAADHVDRLTTALERARAAEESAADKLAELREQVAAAEETLTTARTQVADLAAEARTAEQARRKAENALDKAEARVAKLT